MYKANPPSAKKTISKTPSSQNIPGSGIIFGAWQNSNIVPQLVKFGNPTDRKCLKSLFGPEPITPSGNQLDRKWTNIFPQDKRFTTDAPRNKKKVNNTNSKMQIFLNKMHLGSNSEDQIKGDKTQATPNTIDLRTASGTVDNSMNADVDLLLGIQQSIRITLPNFNEFKSILEEGSDTDRLPGIYQITQPNFNEFIGEHVDYTGLSQDEDALPSINLMLPPGSISQ